MSRPWTKKEASGPGYQSVCGSPGPEHECQNFGINPLPFSNSIIRTIGKLKLRGNTITKGMAFRTILLKINAKLTILLQVQPI